MRGVGIWEHLQIREEDCMAAEDGISSTLEA